MIYKSLDGSGKKFTEKTLDQYPVRVQLDLCDYIPELIERANSEETEAEVAGSAANVADANREALERAKRRQGK